MSGTALLMVLVSAFLHAFWNYLVKKSRNKLAFIWCSILAAVIIYFPMFLYFYAGMKVSAAGWACIAATGILHTFYFFFVGSSYERGDLSVVYPLARGFGPFRHADQQCQLCCGGTRGEHRFFCFVRDHVAR